MRRWSSVEAHREFRLFSERGGVRVGLRVPVGVVGRSDEGERESSPGRAVFVSLRMRTEQPGLEARRLNWTARIVAWVGHGGERENFLSVGGKRYERASERVYAGLGFGFVSEHDNQRFERVCECECVCVKFEKDSQRRRDATKREGRQSDAVEFESTTPAFGPLVSSLKMDKGFYFFSGKSSYLIVLCRYVT